MSGAASLIRSLWLKSIKSTVRRTYIIPEASRIAPENKCGCCPAEALLAKATVVAVEVRQAKVQNLDLALGRHLAQDELDEAR
jgi:hypothetical protein